MSVTPYGKDKLPDRLGNFFMWLAGVRFGDIRSSRYTGFEAPDPLYWVQQRLCRDAGRRARHAQIRRPCRCAHRSGCRGLLRPDRMGRGADLVRWRRRAVGRVLPRHVAMARRARCGRRISRRSSRGKASATSIANSSSRAAFPKPASSRSGGKTGWCAAATRNSRFAEDFLAEIEPPSARRCVLARRSRPRSRGSTCRRSCARAGRTRACTRAARSPPSSASARRRNGSTPTAARNGRPITAPSAGAAQKRFLDHFLKGAANGWPETPRVRIEVRKAYYQHDVRHEAQWPPRGDAPCRFISMRRPRRCTRRPPRRRRRAATTAASGRADFSIRFAETVEITGDTKLRLWVSAPEADDLDLFVVLQQIRREGPRGVFLRL